MVSFSCEVRFLLLSVLFPVPLVRARSPCRRANCSYRPIILPFPPSSPPLPDPDALAPPRSVVGVPWEIENPESCISDLATLTPLEIHPRILLVCLGGVCFGCARAS